MLKKIKKNSENVQKEKEIEKKFSKKIIRKGSLGCGGGRRGGWGCIEKLGAKAAKITRFCVDTDKHTQTARKRAKRPKKRPKKQYFLTSSDNANDNKTTQRNAQTNKTA